MKKQYTKKQIMESIKYWQKQLKTGNYAMQKITQKNHRYLAEATYGSMTADEVRQKLRGIDYAWVEGEGEDFAIYVTLDRYNSPVDSNGYEFDDDGHYERHLGYCEDRISHVLSKADLPEDSFEKVFAYLSGDGYDKIDPNYSWKADYEVYKLVPKRYASKKDIRYYARKTAELYDKAMKLASMYTPTKSEAEYKALDELYEKQIRDAYYSLETDYYLTAHSSEDFYKFVTNAGGYSLGEIDSEAHKRIENKIDRDR